MSRPSMSRTEAISLLASMSPQESQDYARRAAELAKENDDLGYGLRRALEEFAAESKEGAP